MSDTPFALTPRQREVLDVLIAAIDSTGVTPSFQEIVDAANLASKSEVSRILAALEQRGWIERQHNRARAIRILRRPGASPVPSAILRGISWIAQDNALHVRPDLRVPKGWEAMFRVAALEVETWTDEQINALIEGDDDGRVQDALRLRAQTFDKLLNLIFDGELHIWAYNRGIAYPSPPAGYRFSEAAQPPASAQQNERTEGGAT